MQLDGYCHNHPLKSTARVDGVLVLDKCQSSGHAFMFFKQKELEIPVQPPCDSSPMAKTPPSAAGLLPQAATGPFLWADTSTSTTVFPLKVRSELHVNPSSTFSDFSNFCFSFEVGPWKAGSTHRHPKNAQMLTPMTLHTSSSSGFYYGYRRFCIIWPAPSHHEGVPGLSYFTHMWGKMRWTCKLSAAKYQNWGDILSQLLQPWQLS